jgi:Spx/MgsR family transcriptional regulator
MAGLLKSIFDHVMSGRQMKLYGIPNCNTVKKARSWLDEHQVTYEFHDFKKLGIDATTLENWLQQTSLEKLVNRSGMTWRNLPEDEKSAVTDHASAIRLMQDKTSVIKRPVLVADGKLLALGFDESTYGKLLNHE